MFKHKLSNNEINKRIEQFFHSIQYDINGHAIFCMQKEFKKYIDENNYWKLIENNLCNLGYKKIEMSVVDSILLKNRSQCHCINHTCNMFCNHKVCKKCNDTRYIYTYRCVSNTYTFFTHRANQYICIRR